MVEKSCDFCGREVVGSTEKQTDYLLLIHKINRHPEKMDIREIKDEEKE